MRTLMIGVDSGTQANKTGVVDARTSTVVGSGTRRAIGNAVLPGFTAPKILWLKKHEPKNFARLATILLPHDYLNFWLTGEKVMEYGDASGSALLDVKKRKWSPTMLEAIGGGI